MKNDKLGIKERFPLGQMVGTPAALEAIAVANQAPLELLQRHQRGDWGDVDPADAAENELSIANHLRIMSVYRLRQGSTVWVITEADRSVTTILMPDEY